MSQSPENDATAKGVWMVGYSDWNWITESVHASEIEALRIINGRGYGEVHFLPFGVETSEASRHDYVIQPCPCGSDGDGIGGCPRCLGAGEVYVIPPAKQDNA